MHSNTRLNTLNNKSFRFVFFCICFLWHSIGASAQKIDAQIDSLSIKIGQELSYKIEVEVDTSSLVVFPEGQTFLPLEMIESYQVIATKMKDRFRLVKEYGLTQFDSGTYTIPRQKVVIGDYEFFTDSLQVDVNNIVVDTTKQGLYDIKPIVQVSKSPSNWGLYFLVVLMLLGLVVFLLYWFIWKSKPLTEEEKAALLPPYERAKLALKVLDDSSYLQNNEIKAYYSDLTQIIRTYLDEKVYDRALESTTDQLINRIKLLREGNKIDLSKEDIKNIETILKRADLVKFAKSKPDIALAQLDRNTIDTELDQVRQALPEPTEEELLADLKFQEALAEKRKKRRTVITVVSSLLLLVAVYVGLSLYFGFTYVNDTIVGNQSKQLLEAKEWVTSEYGAPGVTMTTPKTLVRDSSLVSEELDNQKKVVTFKYGNLNTTFEIEVRSSKFNPNASQNQQLNSDEESTNSIDLLATVEEQLKQFESSGVQNIITKNEQFITPNGQEGLKTFGTADFKIENTDQRVKANYIILGFTTDYLLQQVILKWKKEDSYSDDIVERIMGSIELLKLTEEDQ
ncbi:hypothetical protein N9R53_05885 [Flavobacteriaceae bacterium]|jgi:hypothetical protein|nr:hypothetical protein [Flavobacteriaceae bacterium]MDC0956332.1 hypothetical protein [Flavobacteriaceae bacterium]MDG1380295.1 hypothetical protein [Flavobacteriaceae bacterium]MDG2349545.1 hypothetical protein [Flavobacteriaceae bacterium]